MIVKTGGDEIRIVRNYVSEYVPKFPLALLFDLCNPNCMSCANSSKSDTPDAPCERCYQTVIISDGEIFDGMTWTFPINRAIEYIMRKGERK